MQRKVTRRERIRWLIDSCLYLGVPCDQAWQAFSWYEKASYRLWRDEWKVATGQKKRRRVGSLPPSPPPNGVKDLAGQTFFVEAI